MFCHTYQSAPIAIYDSGIGGLAITRAIKAILPQESIHYIGDTKNLPYGDKTSTALCDYIIEVINFCLKSRYKLLVIACNTATAASDHFLSSYLNGMGAEMGIVNVIDPVATYIHATSHYNQIALIGTTYTVASGIYTERLRKANLTLTTLATPLLVPMVEACFDGGKVDHRLLGDYLAQIALPNLDVLIPACTHYLFLEKAIKSFFSIRYQKTIEVTDVAKLTALAVKEWLTQRNLLNTTVKRLPDCFMATALIPAFTKASQKLFAQTPIAINLTAKGSLEIFHDIDTKHSAYI